MIYQDVAALNSTSPIKRPSRAPLYLAWGVEAIAVSMGLLLAVYAGREGGNSDPYTFAMAMLPFLALALIEMTKIPIIGLGFATRSWLWRTMAIVALIFVTTATFENFVFGFERGFNERLRMIATTDDTIRNLTNLRDLSSKNLTDVQSQMDAAERSAAGLREDIAALRNTAMQDMQDTTTRANTAEAALQAQIAQANAALTVSLNLLGRCSGERAASCRAARTPAVTAARASLARAQAALDARMASTDDDRRNARQTRDVAIQAKESELEKVTAIIHTLRKSLAESNLAAAEAERNLASSISHRAELVDKSQLHRLALAFIGADDDAAVATTKKWFVGSLAAIVAMIGTVLAILYYSVEKTVNEEYQSKKNVPTKRRGTIGRAIRGYLARRRRYYSVGERLKIVYLPLDATEAEVASATNRALSRSNIKVVEGGVK